MTKSFYFALALSFAALAESARGADGDDHSACKGEEGWLPQNMIIDGLNKKGYEVKRMRQEHGCLEADVVDRKGREWELMVHPSSGQILSVKEEF